MHGWQGACSCTAEASCELLTGVSEVAYLHLDVARPPDVPLQQHAVVAKAGRGLPLRRGDGLFELRRCGRELHALAPSPADGLDQQGEADALGLLQQPPL